METMLISSPQVSNQSYRILIVSSARSHASPIPLVLPCSAHGALPSELKKVLSQHNYQLLKIQPIQRNKSDIRF